MGRLDYYRFIVRYLGLVIFKRHTIGGVAEAAAARYGDAPFLYFEDETLGFESFNRLANRRANFFASQGIGKGDVVALLMENRPEFLTTLVGLGKLGAVTAAINYNLRGQALINNLATAGARKVIVGAECLDAFREVHGQLEPQLRSNVYVDRRWPDGDSPAGSQDLNRLLPSASDANPVPAKMNSKDLFMYIFTSGTTGMPKAARINHYRWYGAGLAMGFYALRARPSDTVYCPLPLYHSNGSLIAFGTALICGARLALTRRFSATKFWDECVRHGATCAIYIGEVLRYVMNTPPGANDRAHKVTRVLGNGLRPDIWEAFQARFGIQHIREFYASTEGNAVTININDKPGSVGSIVLKLSNNLRVVKYDVERDDYVRDAQGFCQLCAPGESGELLGQIKGTTPFYGYSNAQESEKKIMRDVLKKGDSFFRTGDLVKSDAEGNYYFVDRIGDTFRWKGENVSTNEVAEILTGFQGVAFANVYGVSVPGTEGRTGMATLTMRTSQNFDAPAFHRYAAQHLPDYAVPTFLRILPEVEVTGTFKLRKTELKRMGYNPELVSDPMYYRDMANGTYVALDKAGFERISGGKLRF